jgi:hypothetical protein
MPLAWKSMHRDKKLVVLVPTRRWARVKMNAADACHASNARDTDGVRFPGQGNTATRDEVWTERAVEKYCHSHRRLLPRLGSPATLSVVNKTSCCSKHMKTRVQHAADWIAVHMTAACSQNG